jgi:hypothetical protein
VSTTIETKFKSSVVQHFQQIHQEYSIENLPTLVATLLKARGVVQSRKQLWVLNHSGLWQKTTPIHVLKLAIDALVNRNLEQCQSYQTKIKKALGVVSLTPMTRVSVLHHFDHARDNFHLGIVGFVNNYKFETTIFPQALQLLDEDQFEMHHDQDQDVVGACGELFKIQLSRAEKVESRDEMKRFRITKSLAFPLPQTLVVDVVPLAFAGVESVLQLQQVIGNALLANRIQPHTVVQLVGTGAEVVAQTLKIIAGDLLVCPPTRLVASITAKTQRSIATKLQGHRLLLLNVDDSSPKCTSRALVKLAAANVSVLPIVTSINDQTPLVLPDNWNIIYIHVCASSKPHGGDGEAPKWLNWLLNGVGKNKSMTNTNSTDLVNKALMKLVETATSAWHPSTSSEHNQSHRTTIASFVPKIQELAESQKLNNLPITQQLVATCLEKLKFKVKNHSNRLTVEWHSA